MRQPKKAARAGTVAAYVRVSTAGQDGRTQRAAIRRAAEARGDRVGRWFDEKRSGASMERAALDELRGAVRAGLVRRVYVYRIDRITRRGIRDTLAIVDELRAHGCELVTLADGFDLTGPVADVVLAVMAWAAQMERAATVERLKGARARVEAAGGHWGRPRRVDDKLAAKIRRLKLDGKSVRTIAQHVGVPRSTVQESLQRG